MTHTHTHKKGVGWSGGGFYRFVLRAPITLLSSSAIVAARFVRGPSACGACVCARAGAAKPLLLSLQDALSCGSVAPYIEEKESGGTYTHTVIPTWGLGSRPARCTRRSGITGTGRSVEDKLRRYISRGKQKR